MIAFLPNPAFTPIIKHKGRGIEVGAGLQTVERFQRDHVVTDPLPNLGRHGLGL